jgi:(1->4)-alpha-D-glucan 1-alpha-D-glucosylmutase
MSLVDPDNRRQVDFAGRAAVLASINQPDWQGLARRWPDGHIKLAWIRHLLKLRTELADVFTRGDYESLEVQGPHRDHVIAFARRRGRDAAITVAAKSFAPMSQGGRAWPRADAFDATLNLSGYAVKGIASKTGAVPLSTLFHDLPVTVLQARHAGAAKPVHKRMRA